VRNPQKGYPTIPISCQLGGLSAINKGDTVKPKIDTDTNGKKRNVGWRFLILQKNKKAFVSFDEFKKNILGDNFASTKFVKENAVTLEISALQYLPWLITEAKKAITNKELMPGRFIRVRNMKESEADSGDLIAIAAAMNIVGATWVETLDTKGTDGANVHLGGPETITGYFGGPGQPNDYPLKWADEFLYYHTKYGTRQVLT